jgi:RimJ/RimL family protein N-acetyltransferase
LLIEHLLGGESFTLRKVSINSLPHQGFATEGLWIGFEILGFQEIASFAVLGNLRSRAVMERLQMEQDELVFAHSAFPNNSLLSDHCLYRINFQQWLDVQNNT